MFYLQKAVAVSHADKEERKMFT